MYTLRVEEESLNRVYYTVKPSKIGPGHLSHVERLSYSQRFSLKVVSPLFPEGEAQANTKKKRGAIWILVPEALFCACTQYIYTCKLPSSTQCVVSNFRSKSTAYGALASRLHSSLVR